MEIKPEDGYAAIPSLFRRLGCDQEIEVCEQMTNPSIELVSKVTPSTLKVSPHQLKTINTKSRLCC